MGRVKDPLFIFTIGHSTRTIGDFLGILKSYKVARVVDVRTIPRSRHNPQFNRETLEDSLSANGIAYTHMPGLGGLRRPSTDSVNMAWRNATFRGFADYMGTPEFEENLEILIRLCGEEQLALTCAETVPWRCHRSLIADALCVRGIGVEHIMNQKSSKPHVVTPFAKVTGFRVTYPLS